MSGSIFGKPKKKLIFGSLGRAHEGLTGTLLQRALQRDVFPAKNDFFESKIFSKKNVLDFEIKIFITVGGIKGKSGLY